ncbi:hypothetical protein K431DRAFT_236649 [Polychaeton citri CBS 116435]|uniref:HTH CENPB-type domain-containing protein n=1 Tax=Polychaeton citri CBS 116435 TaxID=1314669 RepID=A0A9P4Q010_9PEZI|nr:hypothetical protein K431DRAFT_236649 [Polychaeton citri CBS 116435]
MYSEAQLLDAITRYRNGEFASIRATAIACEVPKSTLSVRLSTRSSRHIIHEKQQMLSNSKEKTIVRWITKLTNTGFPAPPSLCLEIAEEIRKNRFCSTKSPTPQLPPLGVNWLQRFKKRHPTISSRWTTSLEKSRYDGTSVEAIEQ